MTVVTPGRQPDSDDSEEPRLPQRVGSETGYNPALQADDVLTSAHTAPLPPSPGTSERISDEVIDTLHRAFRRLRKSMIKPPQARVPIPSLGRPVDLSVLIACDALAVMEPDDQAISVKDLAAFLNLEHSTVSRLLGEIEADGLVQRSVDPADRRRIQLTLTSLGYRVVDDYRQMQRFVSRTLLDGWSAVDVTELTRLLSKLADTASNLPVGLEELIRDKFQAEGRATFIGPDEAPADQSGPAGRARWRKCRAPNSDSPKS